MTEEELKEICLCGEITKVQFKEASIAQKDAAREMIDCCQSANIEEEGASFNALGKLEMPEGIVAFVTFMGCHLKL